MKIFKRQFNSRLLKPTLLFGWFLSVLILATFVFSNIINSYDYKYSSLDKAISNISSQLERINSVVRGLKEEVEGLLRLEIINADLTASTSPVVVPKQTVINNYITNNYPTISSSNHDADSESVVGVNNNSINAGQFDGIVKNPITASDFISNNYFATKVLGLNAYGDNVLGGTLSFAPGTIIDFSGTSVFGWPHTYGGGGQVINNYYTTGGGVGIETDPIWSTEKGSYLMVESDPLWLLASTTLTVSNFASQNISQWINDAGYLTTSTLSIIESDPIWSAVSSTYLTVVDASSSYQPLGSYLTVESDPYWMVASTSLTVSNFATSSISQWINDAGYLTFSIFGSDNIWTGANTFATTTATRLSVGTASSSALLQLGAGSNLLAPLNFTSGDLLTTTQAGAIEFLNDNYYATISTGAGVEIFSNYPPGQNGTYVKATNGSVPYRATDPTNPLIGDWALGWTNTVTAPQRFHIDLGSAKKITRIYYENGHHNGGSTDRGVKNFTFWGSNSPTAFSDLVYGNDSEWTQIIASQPTFDQHIALNQADPKYISLTNSTAYRYYAFKFENTWGSIYMAVRRIELQEGNNARKPIVLTDGDNLVSGRIPYATTNGRLIDSSMLLYNGLNLSIGTTSVASILNLQAPAGVSALNIASSTGASMFTVTSNGNVGIGTERPRYSLDIKTGRLVLPTGTAAAPSIVFESNAGTGVVDNNTGIYRAGENQIALSAGGIALIWDGGNLALGTAGTNAFITGLYGTAAAPNFRFAAHGEGEEGMFRINDGTSNLRFSTNDTERLSILSGGNVGIGTTTPFAKLSVVGNAYIGGNLTATGTLTVLGDVTGANLNISNWDTAYSIINTSSTYWDTAYGWGNHASAGYLTSYTETDPIFMAASTSIGYLTSNNTWTGVNNFSTTTTFNGRMGIGDSNPARLLSIMADSEYTSTSIRISSLDTNVSEGQIIGGIEFYSNDVGNGYSEHLSINAVSNLYGNDADLVLKFRGTERFRFKSDGSFVLDDTGGATAIPVIGQQLTTFIHNQSASIEPAVAFMNLDNTPVDRANVLYVAGGAGSNESYILKVDSRVGVVNPGVTRFAVYGDGTSYFGGNVGIGTTSPETKLHVYNGDILLSNNKAIQFESNEELPGTNYNVLSVGTSDDLFIGNSGLDSIRFSARGVDNIAIIDNVGVTFDTSGNTAAPSAVLDVRKGSNGNLLEVSRYYDNNPNSILGGFNFVVNSGAPYGSLGNARLQLLGSTTYFSIEDTSNNPMMIFHNSTGNVGIGTTTPSQKLEVLGNVQINGTSSYMINGINLAYGSTTLSNYFFGGAGNLTMTGTSNSALGYQSLSSQTNASNNTAMGYQALEKVTIGSANSAFGMGALQYGTGGAWNTAVGYTSLQSANNNQKNTAIGGLTFLSLGGTTNNDNVAVGYYAGSLQADGSTPLTSAVQSIYIGSKATGYNNSDVNSIVIGYDARGIGANSVVLGNNSILTTALKGNIGIGTTTPNAILTVQGTSTTPLLNIVTSSTAPVLYINNNGNIGIGTVNATSQLTLEKDGATIRLRTASAPDSYYSDITSNYASTNAFKISQHGYTVIKAYQNSDKVIIGQDEQLVTDNSGNVGIGTTTPHERLTVSGNAYIGGSLTTTGTLMVLGGTIASDSLLGGATNLMVDANGVIVRDPSDINLKENISPLNGALEKVIALQGVSFNWKDKTRFGEQAEIGFIAQQVEGVAPQLVSSGGSYLSLKYGNITALLVEAVKEQNLTVSTNTLALFGTTTNSVVASSSYWLTTSSLAQATSAEAIISLGGTSAVELIINRIASNLMMIREFFAERVVAVVGIFDQIKTKWFETDVAKINTGIEIKDAVTGKIYCVKIVNGEWVKAEGDCNVAGVYESMTPATTPPEIINNPIVEDTTPSNQEVEPPLELNEFLEALLEESPPIASVVITNNESTDSLASENNE